MTRLVNVMFYCLPELSTHFALEIRSICKGRGERGVSERRLFAVMWWQRAEAEPWVPAGALASPPSLHQGPTATSGPSSCGPEGCIEGGGRKERRAEGGQRTNK